MKTMKHFLYIVLVLACVLALTFVMVGCDNSQTDEPAPETTETTIPFDTGLVGGPDAEVPYYDELGAELGALIRGTEVEYRETEEKKLEIRVGEISGFLQEGAYIASDVTAVVPAHTLYVRSAVNLRDVDGRLLAPLANKGDTVEVLGCDYVDAEGAAHMYRVKLGDEEGYIMPWYLVDTEEAALENYDAGYYQTHVNRGNAYGGGNAAYLDYFPREKGPIEGNEMPSECRTLYIAAWRVAEVDDFIAIADQSGINAFVVDIVDGDAFGYVGDVMKEYSPSTAKYANNTVEDYQAAIKKIKDAGYYVIGRITTFNDYFYVKDHPEVAISSTSGEALKLSGSYWPTPFSRTAWQYKVDMAVEAVKVMGFNEIQFDYVRFPDSTWSYDKAGTIDYHNTYGESKAQAIQRFLMYAADILHENGAYVSADVYGESAFTYVTAYGQYWPAISNVVDAISGMPYPDHFGADGDYKPWLHPYETLYNWGTSVAKRQTETATPAAVRTWIQTYDAIRAPYNTYGVEEVSAQIKGLRDSGCTGGYMTWYYGSSLTKFRTLIPAFAPPEGEE